MQYNKNIKTICPGLIIHNLTQGLDYTFLLFIISSRHTRIGASFAEGSMALNDETFATTELISLIFSILLTQHFLPPSRIWPILFFILSQFSQVKMKFVASAPIRKKQPSPEKKRLSYTTMLYKKQICETDSGSLVKKIKSQEDLKFDIQIALDGQSPDPAHNIASSKRIELSYRLVGDDGSVLGPPEGDWSELIGMLKRSFPTFQAVELSAPHIIIRFAQLPPSPWPFTIGGLPVRFTDSQHGGHFNPGIIGRGSQELKTINLREGDVLTEPVLRQALETVQGQGIKVYQIFCFENCWSIVVPDHTDLKRVPKVLAGQVCFYKFESESVNYNCAALRAKVPQGVDHDDTNYAAAPDALLRPGIMVSSSAWAAIDNEQTVDNYKKTTSGILVANKDGELFITVATHGFENDGLIYHPIPMSGSLIGRIVEKLPGTGISVAKLKKGLRYTNHTFGTEANAEGIQASVISPGYPPHLRRYDSLEMNNPYSGHAEGIVIGVGLRIAKEEEIAYVQHTWNIFENGNESVESSYGSPIFNEEGMVVGFFAFKMSEDQGCLAVSAMELRRFGYEICVGGEHQF